MPQVLKGLTDEELEELRYHWPFWARDNQLPPAGDWSNWLILAGRGFGKTRCGAEYIRNLVETKKAGRIALVGEDAADVRDVMVDGESGLLATAPRHSRPEWIPSRRRVRWPNGAIATTYSGQDPESLRGPQHDAGWVDELAKMRYQQDVWDNYQFGLRLGSNPSTVITTTPRPTKLLRSIMKDPATITTIGSTYDNRANLPEKYFTSIIRRYEGTRLGRQELNAELLEDTPGALWSLSLLERQRLAKLPCELQRIVVAIDPATTSDEDSAETGIIVAGCTTFGSQRKGYALEDVSIRGTPVEWARKAIAAYRAYGADRIVAEVNNGGEMIEAVLRSIDPSVAYTAVHASRGKITRAEPISALYEQGHIYHVGVFAELEDQMCTYVPGEKSPDRMDAAVWAFTELFGTAVIDPTMFSAMGELSTVRGPWG